MKNLLLFLFLILLIACNEPKSTDQGSVDNPGELFLGAWETFSEPDSGIAKQTVVIVTDPYLSATSYNFDEKAFMFTAVGSWGIDSAGRFVETVEFNSEDSTKMGEVVVREFEFNPTGDTLRFDGKDKVWVRIDDGTPGALEGAWLITGRKRDGAIRRMTPGVRKTMKILSGTRFQWIAYNTETGVLSGTGGGTYTTSDGQYMENIEFFSRDSSRVGASLEFTYQLDSGEWHHSGFSSRGDSLYEIWTPRSWIDAED